MGRENVKKTDKICYCLGGGNLNTWVGGGGGGGGGYFLPKGPEKSLDVVNLVS